MIFAISNRHLLELPEKQTINHNVAFLRDLKGSVDLIILGHDANFAFDFVHLPIH
jgi:hypothetical protein